MGTNISGLYKGLLEPLILRLLAENGRMYGYEITQKAKETSGGALNITEGALYPLLHRLESEELIESETEMIGNRLRKYYSLTKTGKKEARHAGEQLNHFVQTLQLFLKPKLS